MPQFRGNAGNLLQHWVLCEVLSACQASYERLAFIDAYSMAPFATDRPRRDASSSLFDMVAKHLPGKNSLYERAWLKLAPHEHEYPNSAAFVSAVWRNRYSLFLCECDPATVLHLNRWADTARRFPGCEVVEVAASFGAICCPPRISPSFLLIRTCSTDMGRAATPGTWIQPT